MNISDEAIEAATDALPWQMADYLDADTVRAALEAAAPYLMRAAWDEGWEAHGDWGGPTPNPYRPTP